ncbi:MAG: hypothetical protein R2708_23485 [Vicinamibacterales bacterium]
MVLSTSQTLSRSISRCRTCFTSTPRIEVFAARTAAQHNVLPLGVTGRGIKAAPLLLTRQSTADRRTTSLRQHLDVVFEASPLLEPLEDLGAVPTSMLMGMVAGAVEPPLRLNPSIDLRVMVASLTSPKCRFTTSSRSASKAIVRLEFAVAFFASK